MRRGFILGLGLGLSLSLAVQALARRGNGMAERVAALEEVLQVRGSRLTLKASEVRVETTRFEVKAAAKARVEAGATLDLRGGVIKLNRGRRPVARLGSKVTGKCPPVGPLAGGKVSKGSATVLVP